MGKHKETIIAVIFVILGFWKIIDLTLWIIGFLHVTLPTIAMRDIPLIIAILLLIGCLINMRRMRKRLKEASWVKP